MSQGCVHTSLKPDCVFVKHHRENSGCLFRCWCDTFVSPHRWCTMRRTQTSPRSPRWPTAREAHQCCSGVFRNIPCIGCRCWHSHRWATARRAAPYCSEPKKMVGSPPLPLTPHLASQIFTQLSPALWALLHSRALSTAQTFIYNISVQHACASLKCKHYKAFSGRSRLCDH